MTKDELEKKLKDMEALLAEKEASEQEALAENQRLQAELEKSETSRKAQAPVIGIEGKKYVVNNPVRLKGVDYTREQIAANEAIAKLLLERKSGVLTELKG